MNPTQISLQFSEFSTNFYAFYKFLQTANTIEDSTHTEVPGIFYSLTDRSLVCTKHPAKSRGLQLSPWRWEVAGSPEIRRLWRSSRPGKQRGVTVGSPMASGWSELGRGARRRGDSTAAGGGCRGGAGFGEVGARGGQCARLGGSTDPRGEGEAVRRR
jgi:hypothetical protein